MKMKWDDAIKRVMEEADGALHYLEIAERIIAAGYRTNLGATPHQTVSAKLSVSLKLPDTPFERVAPGEYMLKAALQKEGNKQPSVSPDVAETGLLTAFGMFWNRNAVVWNAKPRLLGRQGPGASQVDFADQIGVYLLHDRDRTVYVGRASEALHQRLKAHTADRLSGRWDRFSWFGLRSVNADGTLEAVSVHGSADRLIAAFEALLIEALEPPLNRKRGDNLASVENLQVDDPELQAIEQRRVLDQLSKAA
ncbi:HTH domain-containing protein [Croceicoccus sp. F390]|uniref:HTH domain-containing protein n=1 Tax=Croceicoccus esteveae TaxID=3075597 RepID=A0ABU2ZII7_9SPHN|nr:HTH domain-containing protein [Croceicoccus sp. F390]MDT0575838.1 HTH domain-containing protein [Croceicoccus sp. F390]